MDNEEKKLPPKDNLLEEIGVATALGGSGAALFLHEGSLEHVDKYFRKAKIYKDEIGNFIRNNIDDITQIDSDSITALRNSIDTKLTKYQSTSLSYHPTDDRVLNGLYESFNIKLNSRKELRKLYKNEVKRIAQSSINRYSEELSQEVYDALISNLDAFTSDDNDEILKRLNKRLGAQNFYLASRVANYVIDDVEEWKGIEGNDEKTWIGKRRKEFVETLSDDFFNIDELLKRQNKKNKSIIEKTRRDSHLTLGEVIDTLNADFDSQKSKQLRELLSRDKVLSLDRYSYIEGLKFGEQDTKIFSKIKKIMEDNKDTPEEKAEKISAYLGDTFGTLKQTVKDGELRSSIVLSTLDLIRLQHNALEGDKEKLEAFRSLELDEIFTNKETGNIYTTSDIKKGLRGAVSSLSEYMPIRMLRLGDLEWQDRAEKLYHIFDVGDVDSVLAQELGSGDEFINNHVYAANGKMYVVEDGHFSKRTELENLRDAKIVDNKTGLYKKIAEANSRSKPYPRKQGLLGLAFFKDEDLVDKEADKGLFKKFGAETINKLNALEETFMESSIDSIEAYRKILGVVNDFDDFNRILNETTSLPDINGLKRIYNVVDQSSDGAKFLRYIFELEDDPNNLQEIMESLNHLDNDTGLMETRNPYLAMTIQRYNNDPVGVRRTFINTKEDTYGRDSGSYSSKTYKQTLQQELATEFFLRYSDNPNNNVFQLLEGKFDTYEKKRAAESLVATRLFFERLGVTQEASVIGRFSLLKNGLEDIITSNDAESEKIKEIIANHFIRFGKDAEKMSVKDQEFLNTPAKSVLRKTYLPSKQIGLDLITMINNQQFSKAFDLAAETGFNFVSQFFAGDDMPSNKTAASSLAHFIFNKVQGEMTWDFSIGGFRLANYHLDLRLDPNDTKSSYSIIKNFGKKRILPVMGLFGAYEVLDDFYKATTNMGLGEGLMSGGANAYLGLKKVTGFLGADSVIDSFAKDNVIINYYNEFFGDDSEGWNTYEEQKKYYESGYTPIRKGRFWWWGSSNEFRGGKISYWEPNSLRSLHSDYKDMSLYNGSYWLKYNPERLFNPYYLEELHSEDRPYPISGPMFEQFTPWGIMLNSTVGEILKPKRLLHSDRLSADGVDVKALIYHMNSQIREKAIENNNLFYLQGGQLRSMAFQAYNAPTYSERIITVDPEEESIQANDYGYYNTPVSINNELYQGILESNYRFDLQNKDITFQDQVAIEAAKGNELAQIARLMTNNTGLNLIKAENNKILAKAGYDKSQGMMIEQKLNSQSGAVEDMLNDSEHIAELLQAGKGSDYIHEMAVSTRMITGLYGWGFSKITGIGENNQDRIATSANMDSMSREFWDMNLGGLGGNVMEIGRRFIPEYKRFQTYNPLMNTMPDWLPERFRFGDPFTILPQGEARLPGYGYESLNQLHPDNYGRYGAFDRFKILADIAPFSPEYKFWKQVASKTITDPALKAEMDEIKERVKKQSKQHDFQDYKYVGRDVERRNVYVTEVTKNGQFKVFGSDETFKLAGVRVKANPNETGDQVLARYLQPGQLVQLVVDANEAYGRNKDTNNTINAAVIIDGESIGEQMLANGDAVERENDISVAATIARHGSFVNTINWLSEGIAHLNIPIIHNRFLRVNSPLEDYKDEYLYGSSFQSWDDFYGTYIVPNMRIASDSSFFTGAGILVDILRNNFVKDTKNNLLSDLIEEYVKEDGPLKRLRTITQDDLNSRTMKFAKRAIYYSDRGGLMGSLIGKVVTLGSSDSQKLRATVFRRAGSAATLLYSATQAPENLGVSMMSWSRLAYLFSNEFMGGKKRMLAAGAGALFGLARWGGSINLLSDDSYNGTYIPDSARERWEMQDYFDRLTYIKYMSLYERAAEKAFDEEGVDIKRILERQEEETTNIKESKEELKQYLRELDGKNTQEAQEMKELLKGRLNSLTGSKVPLSGGDYTKSAIMYYNAAKATMYALDENSSMADIVRALPKTDREYFMEFLKERDEEKRKEILSTVSPQIAKALRMMWYKEYNDPESNESFFTRHTLPPPSWSGWNPQVDLADVQAKVIQNEGMTFSDFGIYSSQYRDPNVINAPDLEYNANDSLIETTLKMQALLNGFGFSDVNINVEPSEDSTLQVIANVARVIEYNIGESISNIFSGE